MPECKADVDTWNEATNHAEELLFSKQQDPSQVIARLVKLFFMEARTARQVVDAVLGGQATTQTVFNPSIRRNHIEAELKPTEGYWSYVDRDGDQYPVAAFLCHRSQVRTLVAVKGDAGLICVVCDQVGEDAVAPVIHYLAAMVNESDTDAYDQTIQAIAERVVAVEMVEPEHFIQGPEFSANFMRGLEQIITAELSHDLFTENLHSKISEDVFPDPVLVASWGKGNIVVLGTVDGSEGGAVIGFSVSENAVDAIGVNYFSTLEKALQDAANHAASWSQPQDDVPMMSERVKSHMGL